MKHAPSRHSRRKHAPPKPDILDVHGIAALLTVSVDSVYDGAVGFQTGDLAFLILGPALLDTRQRFAVQVAHEGVKLLRVRAIDPPRQAVLLTGAVENDESAAVALEEHVAMVFKR